MDALLDELDVYSGTKYDKVEAVYDYDNMNLPGEPVFGGDKAYLLAHSAYGALMLKECVCQGYALLMYRLLLELGVDNRIITSVDHGWNVVEVGTDQYYYCDATWDAGMEEYSYFLVGDTDSFYIDPSHVRSYPYNTEAFYEEYPMAWAAYTPG